MGIKDNFSQAVKELMNKEKESETKVNSSENEEIQFKGVDQYMKEEPVVEKPQPAPFYSSNLEAIAAKVDNEKPEEQTAVPPQQSIPQTNQSASFSENEDEMTIISRNTIIDGNIRSFANMSVDGNIKGDVETTKNVQMNGKIIGNITCNNAVMHTSSMQGNVKLKGKIDMSRDAMLIGDLTSQLADINGKIKGNIEISGKAELKKDAVIFGDIKANTISILDGAIVQGYVTTTFLGKDDSNNIFPENIAIGE